MGELNPDFHCAELDHEHRHRKGLRHCHGASAEGGDFFGTLLRPGPAPGPLIQQEIQDSLQQNENLRLPHSQCPSAAIPQQPPINQH